MDKNQHEQTGNQQSNDMRRDNLSSGDQNVSNLRPENMTEEQRKQWEQDQQRQGGQDRDLQSERV